MRSTAIAIDVILSLQLVYMVYFWISNYLYLRNKYQQGYLYLKDYEIKKINRSYNIMKDRSNELIKFIII
jgi:hypothetical protein